MDTPVSLISSVFPDSVFERLQSVKSRDDAEVIMMKMTRLLVKIMQGAAETFLEGKYTLFDANPGDSGCQNQALELGRLASSNLKHELSDLCRMSERIRSAYIERNGAKAKIKKTQCSAYDFFLDNCTIQVSREMCYLIHCFLGTKLRVKHRLLPSGVVLTGSDSEKIGTIIGNTKRIGPGILQDILEKNQEE